MSLSANFYNNTDNPKTVNKTLSAEPVISATITPYQPLSELTGTIILAYDSDLDSANYCSIGTNGTKYYFITDRILLTGGKIQLTLRIDVLMTYSADILNCKAVINRSDTLNNAQILDGAIRHEARQDIEYIDFNNGLSYPEKVIMVCNV